MTKRWHRMSTESSLCAGGHVKNFACFVPFPSERHHPHFIHEETKAQANSFIQQVSSRARIRTRNQCLHFFLPQREQPWVTKGLQWEAPGSVLPPR